LEEVFHCLEEAHIKLNMEKCKFGYTEIPILGHIVGPHGNSVEETKVIKVKNFPTPKNTTQVRSFLGLAGYYRRFIQQFSTIAHPLHQLLRKDQNFKWTNSCEDAFQKLKQHLISAPILARPNYKLPFILETDASTIGLGAILSQEDSDGKTHVIHYASRGLTPAEKNYSATELECLAVVWAIQHQFRVYLEGRSFTVYTDHNALTWLFTKADLSTNSRLKRWVLLLQPYSFTVQYKKGTVNRNADALSRIGF
jgi:hypothetical protein